MSVLTARPGVRGHRWLWFGATAASAVTLFSLGRVATSRPDPRTVVLAGERLARWRPVDADSVTSSGDAESFAVSGGTDVMVLRRSLRFVSVAAARAALAQVRLVALQDGWEPCEDCGWQKPAIDADLGLHVDDALLVITLRAYRRTALVVR